MFGWCLWVASRLRSVERLLSQRGQRGTRGQSGDIACVQALRWLRLSRFLPTLPSPFCPLEHFCPLGLLPAGGTPALSLLFALCSSLTPPPSGAKSPSRWHAHIRGRTYPLHCCAYGRHPQDDKYPLSDNHHPRRRLRCSSSNAPR